MERPQTGWQGIEAARRDAGKTIRLGRSVASPGEQARRRIRIVLSFIRQFPFNRGSRHQEAVNRQLAVRPGQRAQRTTGIWESRCWLCTLRTLENGREGDCQRDQRTDAAGEKCTPIPLTGERRATGFQRNVSSVAPTGGDRAHYEGPTPRRQLKHPFP